MFHQCTTPIPWNQEKHQNLKQHEITYLCRIILGYWVSVTYPPSSSSFSSSSSFRPASSWGRANLQAMQALTLAHPRCPWHALAVVRRAPKGKLGHWEIIIEQCENQRTEKLRSTSGTGAVILTKDQNAVQSTSNTREILQTSISISAFHPV